MLRAVLDANVYVSAAIQPAGAPGRILERFLGEAAFENVLSPAIAEEILAALAYPKVRKAIRGAIAAELWFEDVLVLSRLTAGELELSDVCPDPDDDKYLAAALEGGASFVVTGDHAFQAVREHRGVRIVSPREFLCLLER